MADRIQARSASSKTLYSIIRNSSGQAWRTDTNVFENYSTANLASYTISMTEQGSSGYYTGAFPSLIGPGTYSVVVNQQIGGAAAESDPTVASGNIEWNGSAVAPLSDTATSGLIGQSLPLRIYRGQQLLNFPFKMVSSADHITPFTSGICSGQISRDGGVFGALQSGNVSETGLGWYRVNLTSGDLLCTTVALSFSANGVSGGTADQRDLALVLQRTSGQ